MPQQFKTTFVPSGQIRQSNQEQQNAPQIQQQKKWAFSVLGAIAFFVALSAGVAYGVTWYLENDARDLLQRKQQSLAAAEEQFEQNFIQEVREIDDRIKIVSRLLDDHTVLSPLFKNLQDITLKSVQYNTFNFEFNEGIPVITVEGEASSYEAIAQQSEMLSENVNVSNHILSQFTLQPTGRVEFTGVITIEQDFVSFVHHQTKRDELWGEATSTQQVDPMVGDDAVFINDAL